MELDDLKKSWKSTATSQSGDVIKDAIEKKIINLERSGRGIARSFWIEMILSWAMYVVFLFMMWYYNEYVESYMYKIVVLIGVAMVPIVWRLYKSIQWANSIDYSQDVRSNVVAFLKYFKGTLWIYEWSCYLIVAITVGIMYTDQSFLSASSRVQMAIIVYVIAVALIARPYVYFLYGKKVSVFEDFLKD
jgi:hypothetical protein